MYRFKEKQLSFTDFNQPQGLQMDPENRWIRKAEMIPWDTIEKEYAKLFPSRTGMPAKPLRMALGSLLIQKQYHYPDEELVEQIRGNSYYQYFIGMPGYEDKVIMAAGAFVQGSSIELSADGPLRAPYTAFFQGGLTWNHAKLGILKSLQKLVDANLVNPSQLC